MKLFLGLLTVVSLAAAQTCSFSDPTNGYIYNNLNIAQGNADLVISRGGWSFYLNLCTAVKNAACGTASGICQTWDGGQASLGSASTLAFSSLYGSCGVEHENHDWPGNDLADPVPASSAGACCTLCKAYPSATAYVYSPNTRNCWCKNIDLSIEPGPAEDRVFGYIGSEYSEDGVIATYTNGDAVNGAGRKSVIYLVCNRNAGRGQPTFIREGPQLYYYFLWYTAAACRTGTTGTVVVTTGSSISTTGTASDRVPWSQPCTTTIAGNGNSLMFDLTSLERSDKDYLSYDLIGHTYFVNFCRNTLIRTCGSNAAVCQLNEGASQQYMIATTTQVSYDFLPAFYHNRVGVQVTLRGGDGTRNATLEMICSPNSGQGQPSFVGEEPVLNYVFVWYTAAACPIASQTTSGMVGGSTTAPAVPVETYPTSFFDVATNTVYDMSRLLRLDQDWIATDPDNRPYHINIGRSVITTACANSNRAPAICQTWPEGGYASLGAAHGATWSALTEYSHGKRGLRLNVTNGDTAGTNVARHSIINFYCGDPFSLGNPIFLNEDIMLEYHFEWTTSAACGKIATASCKKQENMDFGGYDSQLSPYQAIPTADACCIKCQGLTSNAFAYQPSQQQCWCKTVPSGSIPYSLQDRTYGTIGAAIGSTTGTSTNSAGKASGLTGLETFLIIAVVFIVLGVAGGFGYVYWKRRQADQQPPSYLHLNLETAE